MIVALQNLDPTKHMSIVADHECGLFHWKQISSNLGFDCLQLNNFDGEESAIFDFLT